MAGHAIPGETVLKQTIFSKAASETVVEDLVAGYMPMVFRIAYSILRNHHDAEDATQECFLKVLRQIRKSNAGLAQVRNTKTWLARVAWTTALDRRSQRTTVTDHEVVEEETSQMIELGSSVPENSVERFPDPAAAPDEFLAEQQRRRWMEKLVTGLPEELRQPLELSTVQELNSSEISEMMGIPEGSVRTRLMRARTLLKEKLATLMEVKRHG